MDENSKRAQRLLVLRSVTLSDGSQVTLAFSLAVDWDEVTTQQLALSLMLAAGSMTGRALRDPALAKSVDYSLVGVSLVAL